MENEIYAVVEITKKDIRFIVGKYRNNLGLKVIFKERVKGNWLNENDEVLDINSAKQHLSKLIRKYENTYNEKIINVGIVYPIKTLKIAQTNLHIIIDNDKKIITHEHIKKLYKDAVVINENENTVVINVRPYEYVLNNKDRRNSINVGMIANSVAMYAKAYTLDKKVVDSHMEVVQKCEKNILAKYIQTYALAKQCIEEKNFKEPSALVDWNIKTLEIGFFAKETLVKKISKPIGIDKIFSNIAKKIYAKNKVVETYIFKMLNFKSTKNDDLIIYRKYISSEKRTLEISIKQLKDLFLEEMNYIIDLIDLEIQNEFITKVRDFKVFFNGKVTEISGFDKMISRSNFKNKVFIYYSLVTGANEIWTSSLCGAIKSCHDVNKNAQIFKTSTIEYSKVEKHQQLMQNNQQGLMQNPMSNLYTGINNVPNIVQNQMSQPQMMHRQNFTNLQNQSIYDINNINNQQNYQNVNNFANQNGIIKKQTNR
ncbi:hypothetical protein [Spiroplasma tabanidicola]|uniref:Cell division protein FtsA n=1 Tax=Spiroplasma tabanidicola TaxID=324079 RepID=A0A6I6C9M7_9MOLU|nr:hypothetical protein [Spiroplasma tabanidicola]QGS52159.1 cell division protein FtsA [Spiroplasma tabanidicola]